MIVLVTDFGTHDPYAGQMHAAIRGLVDTPVVDLLHHMPAYDVRTGAYLLDSLQRQFARGTVFVGVVDPGVGGDRAPVMVNADGKWYVGPDNGLFNVICRRACSVDVFRIDWRPRRLSASFHGRDLFAPVAAKLAGGEVPEHSPWTLVDTGEWPEELPEIIYIDHYGNAMTGIRASSRARDPAGRRPAAGFSQDLLRGPRGHTVLVSEFSGPGGDCREGSLRRGAARPPYRRSGDHDRLRRAARDHAAEAVKSGHRSAFTLPGTGS